MNQSNPLGPESPEALRWTAKRKAALVLDLIRGNTSVAEAFHQHGLTVQVDSWYEDFKTKGS